MTKEEAKQWLRNLIDSSIKRQDIYDKHVFELCYNKQYLRALKLSTITGQPVNKDDFTCGETLFRVNSYSKRFWYYPKIRNYLKENYSKDYDEQYGLVEEVIDEYEECEEYKDYIIG